MTIDPDHIAALDAAATPGPWGVWRETISGSDAAKAELADQIDQTSDMIDALVMLNAAGKCPAITGCGPTSDANAALITALRNAVPDIIAMARENERLRAENENLRKLTAPEWFYLAGDMSSDRCKFSPTEVIDEDWLYYNRSGRSAVVQIETATRLPDIWCAVRFFTDEEKDARQSDDEFEITEHVSEEEARAALENRDV